MQNKPGKTRQINPITLLFLLFFAVGFGTTLILTIGFWSTVGFYGLSAIIVLILSARAPVTGNQED